MRQLEKKKKKKIKVSASLLILLYALYSVTVLNFGLWKYVFGHASAGVMLVLFVLLFVLMYTALNLLVWKRIDKPLMIFFLFASAAATYFMATFGIFMDLDMVRNIFETNPAETLDLMTPRVALWVGLLALLPAIIIGKIKIDYAPFGQETKGRLIRIGLCLAAGFAVFMAAYRPMSSFGRNHREIRHLITPSSYIGATVKFARSKFASKKQYRIIDGTARHAPYEDKAVTVFVLVVGETARAMNFSLNGYDRKTNPGLEKLDVVNFTDVSAAGTSTAVSVPGMFAMAGRRDFKVDEGLYTENLVDLLKKSGYDVWWLENNNGCKGVCNRLDREKIVNIDPKQSSAFCDGMYCLDDVMLEDVEKILKDVKKDTFVVLHTIGSHGPAYYKRYPKDKAVFQPACQDADLTKCAREEIVNAYDNSILHTDRFLTSLIDLLKKYPKYEAGLLYTSDHGESLGEHNVYLHGLPYMIAPKEQKTVPMILWISDVMQREDHIDYVCMKKTAREKSVSHDDLFHSMLGLMEIKSEVYKKDMDFFAPCRTKPLPQ